MPTNLSTHIMGAVAQGQKSAAWR